MIVVVLCVTCIYLIDVITCFQSDCPEVAGIYGNSLVNVPVNNKHQCHKLCVYTAACTGYNYVVMERKSECRLLFEHSGDSEQSPHGYSQAIHVNMNNRFCKNPKKPGPCEHRPCSDQQVCMPINRLTGYTCVPLDQVFKFNLPPPVKCGLDGITTDGVQYVEYNGPVGVDETDRFRCKEGYKATEPPSIVTGTCQADSTWNIPITCTVVRCPTQIDNMTMEITNNSSRGYMVGDTAVFSCITGYTHVNGTGCTTCQANGQWSPVDLHCQNCKVPLLRVRMVPVNISTTTFNSTIYYVCKPNFVRNIDGGGNFIRCLSNGSWSEIQTRLGCRYVCTSNPPTPMNAVVSKVPNPPVAGSAIEYECDNYAVYAGGPKQRLCLDDGTWQNSTLKCETVQQLSVPWSSATATAIVEPTTPNNELFIPNTELTTTNTKPTTPNNELSIPNTELTTTNTKPTTPNNELFIPNTELTTTNIKSTTVKAKSTTSNTELATVNTESTTSKTELTTANTESTTANTESTTANTKSTTANTESTTANTELTTANTELTTANTESTTANIELTIANTELTTVNAIPTTGNAESTTANIELTTANTELITFNIELNTANTESTTANTESTTSNTESTTANTELATANTELTTANTESTTANTESTTSNTESTTANTQSTTSNTESTTANTELTTANTESTTANTESTTSNAESTTANTELTTANTELTTANTELTTVNAIPTTGNAESTTANIELTTANTKLTTANTELITFNIELNTANAESTTANTELITSNIEPTTANIELTTANTESTTVNTIPKEVYNIPTTSKAEQTTQFTDVMCNDTTPLPADAVITNMPNPPVAGSFIEYECVEGTEYVEGFKQRKCLVNGTWEEITLICRDIVCQWPISPYPGELFKTVQTFYPGDVFKWMTNVQYFCTPSWDMAPSYCTKSGWTKPDCQADVHTDPNTYSDVVPP